MQNSKFKRKLNKLLRDPRQFYLDSKYLHFLSVLFPEKKYEKPNLKLINTKKINSWFEFVCDKKSCQKHDFDVVLLVGFQGWKKSFVHKFLPEYQLIYTQKNVPINKIKELQTEYRIKALICWGVTKDAPLKNISLKLGLPIWTMEDGFVRSVELGSNQVEPRSLVLDKSGIYFDTTRTSDLEHLLNTYDLKTNRDFVKRAELLLQLFRNLKISKYNDASFYLNRSIESSSIFEEKSILVVGQLSKDASLLYGGCEHMKNEDLIRAAVSENPERKIVYRPHPDEMKVNKNHVQDVVSLNLNIKIADTNDSLSRLLQQSERVYVMTSLLGLEALLHGKKVTVFGRPFYSGWGLTDDRVKILRRLRKLSLTELFAITYLVYPRYIGDPENRDAGFVSALQLISAERILAALKTFKRYSGPVDVKLYNTIFWSAAIKININEKLSKDLSKYVIENIPFGAIFSSDKSFMHRKFLCYFIGGCAESSMHLNAILTGLRENLTYDIFSSLLSDLWMVRPTPARLEQWALVCESVGRTKDARASYEYLSNCSNLPSGRGRLSERELRSQIQLVKFEIRNKNHSNALAILDSILVSGDVTPAVLDLYGQVAISKQEFQLALEIYTMIAVIDLSWGDGKAFFIRGQIFTLLGHQSEAFANIATACYLNPNFISLMSEDLTFSFDLIFKSLNFQQTMCKSVEAGLAGSLLQRVSAFISIGDSLYAEQLLTSYVYSRLDYEQYLILYSKALSFQGKLHEARALVELSLERTRSPKILKEAFRLATRMGDRNWLEFLINFEKESGLELTEISKRKAATILGAEKLYYQSLRKMASSDHLKKYIGNSFIQSCQSIDFKSNDKYFVLAYFGPGDEIRWASTYRAIRDLVKPAHIQFSCDPRLHSLFSRSFHDLAFVPVKRTRSIRKFLDLDSINKLPGLELHRHLDNRGWLEVERSDYVSLQVDLLSDVIDSHTQIDGKSFLSPDSDLVVSWGKRLNKNKGSRKKVGICWRSSVLSTERSQHYFDISHVECLIKSLPDYDFYCLQYDDCSVELEWLAQRQPGSLHYFEDIDYYNDFENVAALICNLDHVIAPATTIAELAGALGVDTVLFSLTSEMKWRHRPGGTTDVWHSSVIHMCPDTSGDIINLCDKIVRYFVGIR